MRPLILSLVTMATFGDFARAESAKPSVLIVLTDDQGIGDFSFMGNPVLKTPHRPRGGRRADR